MTKKEKYIAVQNMARSLMEERELRFKASQQQHDEGLKRQYIMLANLAYSEAKGVAKVLSLIYPNGSKVLCDMRMEIYKRFGISTERMRYWADKLE